MKIDVPVCEIREILASLAQCKRERKDLCNLLGRHVFHDATLPERKDCGVQLACGGGCGSVAKNKNGTVCSTDCRPVKELLELGFGAYFTE